VTIDSIYIVIAYIPVLHRGYLQFLEKHVSAVKVFLLGEDVLAEFPHLRKDIRALSPQQMKQALDGLKIIKRVEILSLSQLPNLDTKIVMPDEDIMHELSERYLTQDKVSYDSVFLRWDKKKSLEEQSVNPDEEISTAERDQKFMLQAQEIAVKSADWWRQVGAVIVKEGKVISSGHNDHVLGEQQPYFEGDPRGNFHKGDHIELSTAMHAEACLIAQAAKEGISVKGASMYVTTFPCPVCAKLIAYSGIKEVYYTEGYSMLDGEKLLKENGVKIIKVK
jgi:dCMP deaminase